MTDMNKIAEKIQHLLDKTVANGATEAEAQQALLAAQRLMAKYNVELEQLSGTDKPIKCSLEISKVKANPRNNQIQCIIADAFACKPLISGVDRKLMFFGREDNAKAAVSAMEYVAKVLEAGIRRTCRSYGMDSSQRGASDIYNYYAKGFIQGLRDTVAAQTVALAIVVTEDVKEQYNKKFPNLKSYAGKGMQYDVTFRSAYTKGVEDGRGALAKRSLKA